MQKILNELERIETISGAMKLGFRAGLSGPAPVLFAGMTGFGAMTHQAGLSIIQTTAISIFMYALPGQIVFIEMMSLGISSSAIAIAVAFTSSRFLTMVLTLFPQIPKTPKEPLRFLTVHLVAMSTWTFCMRDFPKMKTEVRYGYFLGLGLTCWLVSMPGTMFGFMIARFVPIWISLPLLFINPLFFLLSFLDVRIPLYRSAIVLGCIAGAVFYQIDPGHALLISGLGFGTLVYGLDLILRKWRLKNESI